MLDRRRACDTRKLKYKLFVELIGRWVADAGFALSKYICWLTIKFVAWVFCWDRANWFIQTNWRQQQNNSNNNAGNVDKQTRETRNDNVDFCRQLLGVRLKQRSVRLRNSARTERCRRRHSRVSQLKWTWTWWHPNSACYLSGFCTVLWLSHRCQHGSAT